MLVQREDHFLSTWWRVYVRGQRQGKLYDYFLGTISTGVIAAGPQIYSDSFYRCGLVIHSNVEAAVLRLVDVFNRTEDK